MTPDDLLQGCLEDLETGALPLEDYLARYSDAARLAEPLRAAQRLRATPRPTLSAAVTRAQEARLRAALQAQVASQPPRRRRALWATPRLNWRQPVLRWAMALALVAALLVGGTGVVSAAGQSLPGELLYPVKRTTETVQVALTPPAGRAKLHLDLAQERAEELEAVVRRGLATALVVRELTAAMLAETELALHHIDAAPAAQQAELLAEALASIEQQQTLLGTVNAQLAETTADELASALATAQVNSAVVEATLALMPDPGSTGPTPTLPSPTEAAPETATPAETALPAVLATATPTWTATLRPSATNTRTPTNSPAPSRTPSPTTTATSVPTSTPTVTRTPAATKTPSATPVPPTDTPMPPTATPQPTDPPTPTWTPVPTDTAVPTLAPTDTPPPTPTACPTNRGGRPKCKP